MLDPRRGTAFVLTLALSLACGVQACSSSLPVPDTTRASSTSTSGLVWGMGGAGGGDSTSGSGGVTATGTGGGLSAECLAPPAGGVAVDSGFALQSATAFGAATDGLGPWSLAFDADGNNVVRGGLLGALDLGSGVTLDSPGAYVAYLAKVSPTGQALWARKLPFFADHVFADASGSIWVNGDTNERAVKRYDAAGNEVWSKQLKTLGPIRVVPSGDGSAILADVFYDPISYGTGTIETSPGVAGDAFMMKVDALGAVLWGKTLGAQLWPALTPADEVRSITMHDAAAAPGGGMVLLVRTHAHTEGSHLVLLRVDDSGNLVWKRSFAGIGVQDHPLIAVDAAGNSLISLTLDAEGGGGDLGCGMLPYGVMLAMTDPDGKALWTRNYPTLNGNPQPSFDPSGNVVLAGEFTDPIDLGGGVLPSGGNAGVARIAVAKLSPSGAYLASRAFGASIADTDRTSVTDARTNAAGELVMSLSHQGPLDLGGGPLPDAPTPLGVVARFTP